MYKDEDEALYIWYTHRSSPSRIKCSECQEAKQYLLTHGWQLINEIWIKP